MMKSLCEGSVVIVCVLVASLSSAGGQRCNGGTNCIPLSDCTGLYTLLQKGNTPALTQLLRSLHCGFQDGNIPMTTESSTAQTTELRMRDAARLLPNSRICGIQNNDRIVGGTQADIDEHPWMALIRYDKPVGSGFYCGGVLISARYVLTAGHCVKGSDLPPNWRLSQVRLGEWNTSSEVDCFHDDCSGPVQDIPVEEIIAQEGYQADDPNQHNDIALLRLAYNARFNDFVKPICLPLTNELKNSFFDGYDMEVAGWGKTETLEDELSWSQPSRPGLAGTESDVKLKVRVPIVNINRCANVYERVSRQIDTTQICAGGVAGQDSCRGDSGGPLMGQAATANNWMVLGVVSYGPSPCGTQGWPGVYTRVGAYVDWILSKLRP
ncbi:CLIP domain-containing serine protease HP8 isoform X2 [Helicoverpa armigera]|uniref:CLIP domain-containing serine protease HP8 isoform X2 n=1 Tax=Helicoverpa armigera TaxID=29058 RepID=UPI000B384C98|nr:CLIP domain-containing serine protease HP8 isoform X2 [Helicoverpa armigera]